MSAANFSIGPEDPRHPEVRKLIAESDSYMQERYPTESNHLVDASALAGPGTLFLTARLNGQLVGSIAFQTFAPAHAEMKRLFVRSNARGAGLGRHLVETLEEIALSRHIYRISLETGVRQPEAIGLYRASGYIECPPFGAYKPDPLSLFMTKQLSSQPIGA
ncbi:GNAT family N-acetyltransferase [Hyphomicrobium sp. CS1BSMeth3]|uniref:GNAT family N-acetyltransferase n=1 Tax=Hyphomicrobium sp. CS1BSMeth3 TaxID=1892844 RepID=UPI0009319E66|nr:GNAT family N-acetyltransferase [Hyphomicrobium sp. CS1BSMeth3]